jgi:hypothetical protein
LTFWRDKKKKKNKGAHIYTGNQSVSSEGTKRSAVSIAPERTARSGASIPDQQLSAPVSATEKQKYIHPF